MSLDQKIHQVHQSDPPWMFYFGTAGHIDGTSDGASGPVSISLDKRAFSYWDAKSGAWRVGRGC